ncbi:hypothetical protein ACFWUW_15370 [Streptomyces sp. NPDC058655]|uniref:LppU/SCO3897 family protein n=1 Tax=Streptomyces sp. NPDC058655 TaxID=3346577 RepID=UPI003663A18E
MTQPPQPGTNPYAQTGPNAPQPPQGQPPQPGFPQQQWSAPPAPPAPAPPAKRGIKDIWKIVKVVVVVGAIIAAGIGYFLSQDDADKAKAGDCLKNNGSTASPDLQVVKCSGADATYKVVQVIPDTLDTDQCQGKSDIGYLEQTSGGRRSSGKQFVLCIDELKK